MSYDVMGQKVLDYETCTYDGSRLHFRGPKPDLSRPYVAFLGATETFGKFIESPFPDLVSRHLPTQAVNLGMVNGGMDAYLNDPKVLSIAKGAELRVVQIMGALNLSNHYFRVHPRRNDRFIAPQKALIALFPDVDFAQFHFTKAMLAALQRASDEKYKMVCRELQDIWLARMTMLLRLMGGKTILVWFAEHAPSENAINAPKEPMLVDAEMIARVRRNAETFVQVIPTDDALVAGAKGMRFGPLERPAAEQMLGPAAHREAALALQEACAYFLK